MRELPPPEEPLGSGAQNEEEKCTDEKGEGRDFEARRESLACKKWNEQARVSPWVVAGVGSHITVMHRIVGCPRIFSAVSDMGPTPPFCLAHSPGIASSGISALHPCTLRGGPNIPLIRRNIKVTQVTSVLWGREALFCVFQTRRQRWREVKSPCPRLHS